MDGGYDDGDDQHLDRFAWRCRRSPERSRDHIRPGGFRRTSPSRSRAPVSSLEDRSWTENWPSSRTIPIPPLRVANGAQEREPGINPPVLGDTDEERPGGERSVSAPSI